MLTFQSILKWEFVGFYGNVEIIQYEASQFDLSSFEELFSELKKTVFFENSYGAMLIGEEANFGNHSISKLSAADYELSDLTALEQEFQLPGFLVPEVQAKHEAFLEDANKKITAVVRIHLAGSEKIFRLTDPRDDNRADSWMWDYFYHWIGIDEKNKKVQLISMGRY